MSLHVLHFFCVFLFTVCVTSVLGVPFIAQNETTFACFEPLDTVPPRRQRLTIHLFLACQSIILASLGNGQSILLLIMGPLFFLPMQLLKKIACAMPILDCNVLFVRRFTRYNKLLH